MFVNTTKVELIAHTVAVNNADAATDLQVVNAARVSYAKHQSELNLEKDVKLLDYLSKHGHWSPFAHTSITVRCSVPIFLARQLVKHQIGLTWNEESRRYIDSELEFYIPPVLHKRPTNSKQGRGEPFSNNSIQSSQDWIKRAIHEAHGVYKLLLVSGVAPEEARMVLPLNAMTNFYWTGSLAAFARVVQQRSTPHAQLIANEFAQQLSDVLYSVYPEATKALLTDTKGE
jgi:thymidylate synthase (FAD)